MLDCVEPIAASFVSSLDKFQHVLFEEMDGTNQHIVWLREHWSAAPEMILPGSGVDESDIAKIGPKNKGSVRKYLSRLEAYKIQIESFVYTSKNVLFFISESYELMCSKGKSMKEATDIVTTAYLERGSTIRMQLSLSSFTYKGTLNAKVSRRVARSDVKYCALPNGIFTSKYQEDTSQISVKFFEEIPRMLYLNLEDKVLFEVGSIVVHQAIWGRTYGPEMLNKADPTGTIG